MHLEEKEFLVAPITIGQTRSMGEIQWGALEEESWPDGEVVLFRQALRLDTHSKDYHPYTLVVGFKASEVYAKSQGNFQERAIKVRIPEAAQRRELTAFFREKFENHPVMFFE